MAVTNLGQVRDKITSIARTSGTGAPGTDDTYTIYTECSPAGAGTFTVHNGADGSTVLATSTPLNDIGQMLDLCQTTVYLNLTDSQKRATTAVAVMDTGLVIYANWAGKETGSSYDTFTFRVGPVSGSGKCGSNNTHSIYYDQKNYYLGNYTYPAEGFRDAKAVMNAVGASSSGVLESPVKLTFHTTSEGGKNWVITAAGEYKTLYGYSISGGDFIARNTSSASDSSVSSVWVIEWMPQARNQLIGPFSSVADLKTALGSIYPPYQPLVRIIAIYQVLAGSGANTTAPCRWTVINSSSTGLGITIEDQAGNAINDPLTTGLSLYCLYTLAAVAA